jgi:hypothetical protein
MRKCGAHIQVLGSPALLLAECLLCVGPPAGPLPGATAWASISNPVWELPLSCLTDGQTESQSLTCPRLHSEQVTSEVRGDNPSLWVSFHCYNKMPEVINL